MTTLIPQFEEATQGQVQPIKRQGLGPMWLPLLHPLFDGTVPFSWEKKFFSTTPLFGLGGIVSVGKSLIASAKLCYFQPT